MGEGTASIAVNGERGGAGRMKAQDKDKDRKKTRKRRSRRDGRGKLVLAVMVLGPRKMTCR